MSIKNLIKRYYKSQIRNKDLHSKIEIFKVSFFFFEKKNFYYFLIKLIVGQNTYGND